MLKVFLEAPAVQSFSIGRVAEAMKMYAPPEVHVVDNPSVADVVVLHVIGRCEQVHQIADGWLRNKKKVALVQYCLRSTQKPGTSAWVDLWRESAVVWSYYDLPALCKEDGVNFGTVNFYHAPLGSHASVFYDRFPRKRTRRYVVGTHGFSWLTEGVREAVLAARQVNKQAFHLGPKLKRGGVIDRKNNISDDLVAEAWSKCDYVCGLRRIEGFELPAVEGLLCGARPLLYDRPHYRNWYGDLATYVEETDRAGVVDQLAEIFRSEPRRVTRDEVMKAKRRFYWPDIIGGFWGSLCQTLESARLVG